MDKDEMEALFPRLKSPGRALLYALLFGGIGLFHLSPVAGVFLLIVDVLIYILAFFSGGFGLILLIPWRLVAVLYAMTAVARHNRRILGE